MRRQVKEMLRDVPDVLPPEFLPSTLFRFAIPLRIVFYGAGEVIQDGQLDYRVACRCEHFRVDQPVPPFDVPAFDASDVDRAAIAGLRPIGYRVLNMQAADPDILTGRCEP